MNLKITVLFVVAGTLFLQACNKDHDDKPPVIEITAGKSFPVNCDTVYLGETFVFTADFFDNTELGAYSLDIHHNFDRHTHSTEESECALSPVQIPENPWVYINQYVIPPGTQNFTAGDVLTVPNDVDTGDYHFYIRLTDKSGWQTIRGLSIKVLKRE